VVRNWRLCTRQLRRRARDSGDHADRKQYLFGSGAVGLAALNIAHSKSELGFMQPLRWGPVQRAGLPRRLLSFSCRSVVDRILAIVFPVTAFVAAGFEHCVANMYFIPMGLLIKLRAPASFWAEIGKTPATIQTSPLAISSSATFCR